MRSVSGRLGRRLLARSGVHDRENGLGLARAMAARHRPATLARATRLAIGRTIRPAAAHWQAEAGSEPGSSRPAHMSQFAFDWIFGDGPPQGVPYAGGGALARELAEAPAGPAASGPAGPPRPPGAERARVVEEIPARHRLSRTPLPGGAEPAAAPESEPPAPRRSPESRPQRSRRHRCRSRPAERRSRCDGSRARACPNHRRARSRGCLGPRGPLTRRPPARRPRRRARRRR